MKTLVLMRHAKSDWGSPAESDFDRPLNPRGQTSARDLGNWLREKALHPTEALVSSARRTQETWELLAIRSCQAWFLEGLYHGSDQQMMTALKQAKADSVLIIGHNPGIASFAQDLIGPHKELPVDFHRYPTGATSVIGLSGLCCTNRDGDSLHESSVIAGVHEQLVPDEVPDKKLVFIQCRAEATRIFVDLV